MSLKMKPVLMYGISTRKEETPWRMWGGVQTEEAADEEAKRIGEELEELASAADFPLEIMPLSKVKTAKDARETKNIDSSDAILIYAAGGHIPKDAEIGSKEELDSRYAAMSKPLEAFLSLGKPIIIFMRHKSGPLYLWYEILHPRFFRKSSQDKISRPGIGTGDVVVDDYKKVLWRLRSLFGLKLTSGEKIIVVGEPSGWGVGSKAVENAKDTWSLDVKTVSNQTLEQMIDDARKNEESVKKAQRRAEKYLSREKISLDTKKEFVINSFLLTGVLEELLKNFEAEAITIKECMTTVIPATETTACLSLSVLNDEGYSALCESDFVAIPAALLLRHVSGKPVFLADPTYPHDGVVTLAHCTSPRKMNGTSREKTKITTHFESDYGAAPKVEMKKNQEVTVIDPDFSGESWIGFKGKIADNTNLPICRSQIDIDIIGDWKKLLKEMRGFHWIVVYGDYLKEVGYALKKVGIEWTNISK